MKRMKLKSMNFSPSDPSPRSNKTEEVAAWRRSPRRWRLRRWELSHQRLFMSASPWMGATAWMWQGHTRPRYPPCKGEREVRPSRRDWSSWWLGRVQPGVQKSYLHALLVLLLRRPPCARESSCLLARLPPLQDVVAELHAPGVLCTGLSLSSPQKSRRVSCPIDRPFYRILLLKVDIHPPS